MLVEDDPVATGMVSARGQRIAWQEFGTGDRVLLMMPTWSIVHNDFWRHQVPWLAQRYRVLAFDGLGNGASDRPTPSTIAPNVPLAAEHAECVAADERF